MDLKEAELLGADATTHWYYVAKGRALRTLLGAAPAERVLDVGAGTGVFSRQLLDAGIARSAVCVDTGYDREWSEVQNGRTIQFVREVKDVGADLVLMMDVLEHVSDDESLLSRYTESLPAGARVAI